MKSESKKEDAGHAYSGLAKKPVICIVGGGNASHVLIPYFRCKGHKVTVFAGHCDEAKRLTEAMAQHGGITVFDRCDPKNLKEYSGRPNMISKDPSTVVPQADIVVMALPSFAFKPVLTQIKAHLKEGAIIFGMPGQGGLDLVALSVLGPELLSSGRVTVAGLVPMPLNCRIMEWGKSVDLASIKDSYDVAAVPARNAPPAAAACSALFDRPTRALSHYCAMALHASNPNIHPARLYGLFSDFKEGKVYAENPLFYETFDEPSAAWVARVSDERLEIWREVLRQSKGAIGREGEVPDIQSYIISIYGKQIHDARTVASVFSTNDGFKGFRCPMKKLSLGAKHGGGWTLDFANRYFTEDIPEGFCVYKGIADLAGVATPAIDEILGFFQRFMGKEYLVKGRLAGKDVRETKAPQAFGITGLAQYLEITSSGGVRCRASGRGSGSFVSSG